MTKIPALTVSCSLLLAAAGQAQTTIPSTMNYQGHLTDSTGLPVGASGPVTAPVALPVNRKIRFRIYDSPTAGIRKWTEEQTVTVSLGEISVLIGDQQGSAVTGEANAGSFASVFTNLTGGLNTRYLSVMVDNGNGTWGDEDQEISPRQQITATAFAFRAKVAESLVSGGLGATQAAPLHLVGPGGIFQAAAAEENTVLMFRDGLGQEKTAFGLAGTSPGAALSSAATAGDTVLRADGQKRLILQNGSGAPGLTVAGNRVGVGTVSPQRLLQVGDSTINGTEGMIRFGSRGPNSNGTRLWDVGVPNGTDSSSNPKNFCFIIDDIQVGGPDPEFMVQSATGFVGIGTVSPSVRLEVKGSAKIGDRLTAGSANAKQFSVVGTGGYVFDSSGDTDGGLFSPGDGIVTLNTDNVERVRIGSTGNVSIGSNTTTEARLTVSGVGTIERGLGTHMLMGQYAQQAAGGWTEKASIYATNAVHALIFRAFSDERIKNILSRSDSAEDLRTLMEFAITNYTYKDTATHGSGISKKIIAQQLRKVYPQAVQKTTDVVPDIFKKAAAADGWVTLDTDLKTGERVKLLAENTEGVYEVLEISPGKFRTAFNPRDKELFVYGREVRDFLTVDYEAIAMLNVSATQQLKREKDEEIRLRDGKIARLESQLAEMATQGKDQEARLVRLERALASATAPQTPSPEESKIRTASR